MESDLTFDSRPSVTAYMLRAFRPARGLRHGRRFPALSARWLRHRIDRTHLDRFLALTGLRCDGAVPLLYPHVLGFPLQMVVLTHPRFPVPIWRVLQIRNHLKQHRPIARDEVLELDTRIGTHRILEKGAEVDLHTTVHASGELAWESVNTFYFRGRFGTPEEPSPLARSPEVGTAAMAAWPMNDEVGLRFAELTGDYNGIHWSDRYARLFGFRRAFHHPQVVIGQCLAHLRLPLAPVQRLDVWLKGPVHYHSNVRLRASLGLEDLPFALEVEDDERPAIIGRWSSGANA